MRFPIVRHNNLGPILHHFTDIAGFSTADPTPIPANFRAVSVGPDRRCWGHSSRNLSLFGREIIFEVFQRT